MKTDDLIEMLARQDGAVDRRALMWRWVAALAVGFLLSMFVFVYVFRINPDLRMLMENIWFWVRFAFIASVTLLGAWFFAKLGKPGSVSRVPFWLAAAPFVLLGVVGVLLLLNAAPSERRAMLLGISWSVCSRNIAMLAVPIFFASVWVARQFAPVRLRLTGAMLGLFSGGAAALMYSMYCPELEPMFLVIWYGLGMLIPAAVGALLGRKLLSW
jgi:hypothetical protein